MTVHSNINDLIGKRSSFIDNLLTTEPQKDQIISYLNLWDMHQHIEKYMHDLT